MDQLIFSQTILEAVKGLLSGEASTVTYIVVALIPLCIAIAVREIWCWFFKQTKLVSKMERVEKQLVKTNIQLGRIHDLLGKVLEERNMSSASAAAKEPAPKATYDYGSPKDKYDPEERAEPKSLGDRKFSL